MLRRALRLIRTQEPYWQIAWLNPDIAIGSVARAEDWRHVYGAGVRAIVDLRDDPGDLGAVVRNEGMRYLRLCLRQGITPGPEEMHIVTGWLCDRNSSEGPVMIQDVGCVNNDGLLACAALIRTGLTYDLAMQALERVRPETALTYDQASALLRFTAEIATPDES
ncbi:MAG TPA: hypothetical protein VFY10_13170 [Dehalococcoidia bacterium]|nr:hypothetical protein [Dehalococcoidia bacterium]